MTPRFDELLELLDAEVTKGAAMSYPKPFPFPEPG